MQKDGTGSCVHALSLTKRPGNYSTDNGWQTDLESQKESGQARNLKTWRTTTWWVWGLIVLCPMYSRPCPGETRNPEPPKTQNKQTSKACILWLNLPLLPQPDSSPTYLRLSSQSRANPTPPHPATRVLVGDPLADTVPQWSPARPRSPPRDVRTLRPSGFSALQCPSARVHTEGGPVTAGNPGKYPSPCGCHHLGFSRGPTSTQKKKTQ